MPSKNQTFSKITIAILLMVFIFALGNLVFNLENLYLGEEQQIYFIDQGAGQSNAVATDYTLAHALRWIYFGLLAFGVLAIIIGAYSFTRDKDKKKWRNLFFQLASAVVVCIMLVAFGYFYDDIESTVMNDGDTNILPVGGTGNVSSADGTEPPSDPEAMKIIMTFAIFASVFIFWILAFIGISVFARMRSSKLDYSDLDLQTQEVAETIQRTIDALAGGSDTRATVIRCYTDMCNVMSKYGVMEQEHLTPREFEELAREALPVPDEQIHDLVMVFEEARYSDHELTTADSQRAVNALEAVKIKLMEYKAVEAEGAEPDGV